MDPATYTGDLRGTHFIDADLSGSIFTRSNLSGIIARAAELGGAELDAPWLLEPGNVLLINGVDVVPLIDTELNRRFPGRELRSAPSRKGLHDAWFTVERAWDEAVARVQSMPSDTPDVSIAGEWSFAQTLRHLVMAIDTWLGRAILEREDAYHPIGQPNHEYATDGYDPSVFSESDPSFARVLEVRGERNAMVRDYLDAITDDDLDGERRNPWGPDHRVTVRGCLHTILEEHWEHLRFATRDLDAIEAGSRSS